MGSAIKAAVSVNYRYLVHYRAPAVLYRTPACASNHDGDEWTGRITPLQSAFDRCWPASLPAHVAVAIDSRRLCGRPAAAAVTVGVEIKSNCKSSTVIDTALLYGGLFVFVRLLFIEPHKSILHRQSNQLKLAPADIILHISRRLNSIFVDRIVSKWMGIYLYKWMSVRFMQCEYKDLDNVL